MSTAVLGSSTSLEQALAVGLDARALDLGDEVPEDVTGVVIVVGTDPAPTPTPTSATEPETWRQLVDEPIRRALGALQRAHANRCGRIVVVTPTIGLSGAPSLVPYTTAIEGIRAMTKSAARQWASDGIGVNMVAAPLELFEPTSSALTGHLTAAARPDDGNLVATVVETAKFLLRCDIDHLVGTTVIADAGAVMLP